MPVLTDAEYYRVFRINGHIVDPLNNRIIRGREELVIEQKMMQVLVCLAHRRGEIVSRDELMDFAWHGAYVTEETLTRCISLLRKLFDDRAHQPLTIKTVRNQGYQLIVPVIFLEAEEMEKMRMHSRVPSGKKRDHEENRISVVAAGAGFILLLMVAIWYVPADTVSVPVLPDAEVPFTALEGREVHPSISPDGSKIAYVWSGPELTWDLYVQDVSDGEPRQLTDTPEMELGSAWSPDGSRIAFIRNGMMDSGIYVIPAEGGVARKVADRTITGNPTLSWSPNGRWLAFADNPGEGLSTTIFSVPVEGGERNRLTSATAQHWGHSDPSFSPDGSRMAYTSSVSMGTSAIFVLDLDSGEARRLTHQPLDIFGHTWTENGNHIIYSSGIPVEESLWLLDVKTGESTWLNRKGRYPKIDRAGDHLVVERRLLDIDLEYVSTGTGTDPAEPGLLLNSTRLENYPAYGPNGRKVAFVSDRTGTDRLWMADLSADSLYRASGYDGSGIVFPRWSPDGRYISFNGFSADGNADLFVYDTKEDTTRQVTAVSSSEVYPVWSPDGRSLYFGSNRNGSWEIWNIALGGDSLRRITHVNAYAGYPGRDGSDFYFTRYDRKGLWHLDVNSLSLEPELVMEHFDYLLPSHWTYSGGGIYFLRQQAAPDTGYKLMRFDIASGETEMLVQISNGELLPSFSLHPDGNGVLLSRKQIERTDVHLFRHEISR